MKTYKSKAMAGAIIPASSPSTRDSHDHEFNVLPSRSLKRNIHTLKIDVILFMLLLRTYFVILCVQMTNSGSNNSETFIWLYVDLVHDF